MAVISWSRKYLCLLSPGTGSSSIGTALLRSGEGQLIPSEDVLDATGKVVIGWKHTTIDQLLEHKLLTRPQLDALVKFAAVRNPFDFWAAEWYRKQYLGEKLIKDKDSWVHKVDGARYDIDLAINLDFPQWVVAKFQGAFEAGTTLNTHALWIDGIDHVLRFESLQSDFDRITQMVGLAKIKLPRINVRRFRNRNYHELYDERSRQIVEQVFGPDLERFGYSF
ncbi:sulfotransferase family protein [Azospirillum brasilense]|nr:sulfotransferase family protein [Azospirillum brasilense]